MAMTPRRKLLAGWLTVAALCMGCNPITALFFLMPNDPKKQPDFSLARKDGRESKVVVLCSAGPGTEHDFIGVDRTLGTLVIRKLEELTTANKEKVQFLTVPQVERYKADHPNWKTADPSAIGRHFEADYVVSLEIVGISLYEPGTQRKMFRGSADVSIEVTDVKAPGEPPVFTKQYSIKHPTSRGPVPVDFDSNADQFKQQFLNRMALELAWMFTPHLLADDFMVN